MNEVAKVLNISPEAIKRFSEDITINFVNNANDNSVNQGNAHNYFPNFNPLDKVIELYEESKALYECCLKRKMR